MSLMILIGPATLQLITKGGLIGGREAVDRLLPSWKNKEHWPFIHGPNDQVALFFLVRDRGNLKPWKHLAAEHHE